MDKRQERKLRMIRAVGYVLAVAVVTLVLMEVLGLL
jgi:hypothetical protein